MNRDVQMRIYRRKFSWIDAVILIAALAYGVLTYAEAQTDIFRSGPDVRLMMAQPEFDARFGRPGGRESN